MFDASTKRFISYAQADEPDKPADGEVQWLSFVRRHLNAAEDSGVFEVWVDHQMDGGTDWSSEIETKLLACDIFLLLVSPCSMASRNVDKEIKLIRARQANGERVHFYPLLLRRTTQAGLDKIKDLVLRPRGGKPLSGYFGDDRDQHMTDAANEIEKIARDMARKKKGAALPASEQDSGRPPAFPQCLPDTSADKRAGPGPPRAVPPVVPRLDPLPNPILLDTKWLTRMRAGLAFSLRRLRTRWLYWFIAAVALTLGGGVYYAFLSSYDCNNIIDSGAWHRGGCGVGEK